MCSTKTYLSLLVIFIVQTCIIQSAIVHFEVEADERPSQKCPCLNPKWCEPVTDTTRKEVFAFSLDNKESHWRFYDWSKVTTVVMFGYINQTLMCLAHSHNARAISLASVDEKTFMSPELRKKWIQHQIAVVKSNFLDGVNFDYESAIKEDETDVRDAYTALVRETNKAFKKEMPYSQITVDVAWKPNIDLRFYDYVGLSESSDFLFIMAYDEQSQIYGACLALPNSSWLRAFESMQIYLNQLRKAIPASKLVLGVPWYGYWYKCIDSVEDKCYIKPIPFRGVNCSDAAGTQIAYPQIYNMSREAMIKWNATSYTPYFNYYNTSSQELFQMQFDNPFSLSLKYKLAHMFDLRGVGMWNIDYLDYSDTAEARMMRDSMFDILPSRNGSGEITESGHHADVGSVLRDIEKTPAHRSDPKASCPCSDPKLCEPIKDMNRKEVFAFSNENNETHWRGFDWSKLTTVVMFNYMNTSLMCLAHSHGVRAVVLGALGELIMITPELRSLWIEEQVNIVKDNFLDGLNFDYEHTLLPPMNYYREAFTDLVTETVTQLRKVQPYAQVSVCTVVDAFNPHMSYDYPAIAQAVDFLFIMAYDESGTLHNGPNSGYHMTKAGVETFLKKKIPPSKLVMGLPWYGDVYQCQHLEGDNCIIEPSGKGFGQWSYDHINATLEPVAHNYRWNASSLTPYFTYTEPSTKISRVIQFDDPHSLSLKYQLAVQMGIRGVGMFLIDGLDYSDTQRGRDMRKAMFDPLPSWKAST